MKIDHFGSARAVLCMISRYEINGYNPSIITGRVKKANYFYVFNRIHMPSSSSFSKLKHTLCNKMVMEAVKHCLKHWQISHHTLYFKK
jgi:hypothetical protein